MVNSGYSFETLCDATKKRWYFGTITIGCCLPTHSSILEKAQSCRLASNGEGRRAAVCVCLLNMHKVVSCISGRCAALTGRSSCLTSLARFHLRSGELPWRWAKDKRNVCHDDPLDSLYVTRNPLDFFLLKLLSSLVHDLLKVLSGLRDLCKIAVNASCRTNTIYMYYC